MLWDLCRLALCTDVWCVLVWVAAMTGDATRAAAGRTKASAAIRRLNEVFTSVCSEGVEGGGDKLTVGANVVP